MPRGESVWKNLHSPKKPVCKPSYIKESGMFIYSSENLHLEKAALSPTCVNCD
jgi:hypothetical protein